MNSQIEQLVKDCEKCATFQNSLPPESLKPTPVPDLPYAVVGCDLFDFESKKYLVVVDYFSKTTPLEEVNLSPSQLLMGRRPRNTLPAASEILRPKSQNLGSIKQGLQSVKDKQKASFDNKWNNKELLPLYPTDPVRVKPQQGEKEWIPGVIVRHHEAPRSYMVQVGNRQLRRNRKHLRSSTHKANETIDDQPDDGKLHVESLPKESSQEPTILTQATTNKTENSDHTQQASTSITPKPKTTRSGRRVIPFN
uniref:Uncharacterized protein n=1 Tax=Magallana gigas TaxID=29159 RepID=A0A8W8JBT8_MAGGI